MKYKLGTLATVKGGKRLPKGISLISTANSHPYIRVRDLSNKRTLELNSDYQFVDNETQKQIARYIVQPGNIILSIVGTIGLVAIVGESLENANLTENCVKIVATDAVDSKFLYYYLISPIGQAEIAKRTVGAVQAKLPIKNIQDIDVWIPQKDIQIKIATMLSCIDDKIELNNKINENLERQAQELFKAWFVDFKLFGGEQPTSWKTVTLDSISELISRGISPQYTDISNQLVINQKCIRNHVIDLLLARTHVPKKVNEKWLRFGDLLINSTGNGTLGRAAQIWFEPQNLTVDSHVTIVRPKNNS
ncbi:MAG: restriction endonuclease subunit S, partial [Clostridium sp.]